jgi:transcriptional regulator GlxA family with amidase domain
MTSDMQTKITVGILIFPEAEELDFVGPLEVFGMVAEFGEPCHVLVLGEMVEPIRCAHGMLPDRTLESALPLELLFVPGGRGARLHARNNPRILEFVRRQTGIVASVCTGAVVLAAAGLLDGIEATTHCAHYDLLRQYDKVTLREGVRFVMHDRVATSAGVTAGIDLALALVQRLYGESMADRIAQNLEWNRSEVSEAGPTV